MALVTAGGTQAPTYTLKMRDTVQATGRLEWIAQRLMLRDLETGKLAMLPLEQFINHVVTLTVYDYGKTPETY